MSEASTPSTLRRTGFFLGPALFLIILIFVDPNLIAPGATKVMAVGVLMITWWITEAVPNPVAALVPLILFPALGIMSMSETAAPFANPAIFLFMGGFMIALALEKHNLHERIAINLIRLTGTSGNGIILGFTLSTGLISMWISNTATALMMLPIGVSVIQLLRRKDSPGGENLSKGEKNFALGLMLSIGYAASLGGMATIIGTPPNVVFAGFAKEFYNQDISFFRWMIVGVPLSVTTLFACYWMITRFLFPNNLPKIEGSEALIANRLRELGPMRKEERLTLLVFALTSSFWIFQQQLNSSLGAEIFNDTNIAITGGVLMFLVPVNFKSNEFLISWDDTKRLPWGILILFGGGIALAKGMESTGIIKGIGDSIAGLQGVSIWEMMFILTLASIILTEFMSNVALVTIFVPVVFGIAKGLNFDPYILALPVTFAASCAFMFPISTPPNAIVFSSGHIKMKDMVKGGIVLDIVCLLIIFLFSYFFFTNFSLVN
ncbi:MAG TPA: DASS family sodium-coupled anion symporter [Cyclobacteriaceae bacterium]|nr:DASS family sodium-coupled anion symporter [Cyclobacteriaceae bacterium]